MDKQTFKKQINTLNKEAEKLSALIEEMGLVDITQAPERYEAISVNAALKSEYITCQLRHLIYETTFVKKTDYLISTGETHGITVGCNNDVIEIILPCLLPKRKQHRSVEFLIDPLFYTLNEYAHSHKLPKFQHCVICFSHIYDQTLPLNRIRDYDNLEQKQILDTISTFIMEDDTGLLCDAYNTTELGDSNCTLITVMSKNHFPKWLEEHKNKIKTISDF